MKYWRGLLLLLLILTACQPASPDSTTPVPSATETPQPSSTLAPGASIGIPPEALKGVTIQVWMPWFGVDTGLFLSQVNDFNTSNQWGISVQASSHYNYTELYNDVTAALHTPDLPQVVIAFPEHALAWDHSGQVVDLTRYVADSQYGPTDQEIHDFPSVFWSQDTIGTKRLGLPAERTARFLLYNVSWGHDLGFDSPPQSYVDFRQQSCRAHQAMLIDSDRTNDGQGGWLVDTSAMTFLSWMSAFGGGVLDGNGYRFLTPKNLSALTFVKQLYDDGCAWTAQPDTSEAEVFAGRQALFVTVSLEQVADFSRAMGVANNGDDWVLLAYPGPVQAGLVAYGSSYVILKGTPQQQLAAWLFVRWLLSPENQKAWVEATGLFPLRTSELAQLTAYRSTHPQWSQAVDLLPRATIQPQLPSWRQVMIMVGDGFDAMFRSNTPPGRVAEILAIMGSTANDLSK